VFALTITLLTALYLLGPSLLSRAIRGLLIPPKITVKSNSEEIANAVVLAIFPLVIAVVWTTTCGKLQWKAHIPEIETFFSCVSDDKFFDGHRVLFFGDLPTIVQINWSLLWRLYTISCVYSLCLSLAVINYGRLRYSLKDYPKLRQLLTVVVNSSVSDWHLLLSNVSLQNSHMESHIDLLIRSGILYRGKLEQAVLSTGGEVSGLILSSPFRFERDRFLDMERQAKQPKSDDFWRTIPRACFINRFGLKLGTYA
jgi:hypothetical protein